MSKYSNVSTKELNTLLAQKQKAKEKAHRDADSARHHYGSIDRFWASRYAADADALGKEIQEISKELVDRALDDGSFTMGGW